MTAPPNSLTMLMARSSCSLQSHRNEPITCTVDTDFRNCEVCGGDRRAREAATRVWPAERSAKGRNRFKDALKRSVRRLSSSDVHHLGGETLIMDAHKDALLSADFAPVDNHGLLLHRLRHALPVAHHHLGPIVAVRSQPEEPPAEYDNGSHVWGAKGLHGPGYDGIPKDSDWTMANLSVGRSHSATNSKCETVESDNSRRLAT